MKGLNNRQFITLALIIMICGLLIIARDYFFAKKVAVYEQMSILLSQNVQQSESDPEDPDTSQIISDDDNDTNENGNSGSGDTSGKVKKSNVTYNYIGRLIIPKINLNRGFVAYGTSGNNVDQNIAIMGGSQYPNEDDSNFILAAHNGSGWNAFFTNIDKLVIGDKAYVNYDGKQYAYKLVKTYSDPKGDKQVTIYKNYEKKQLTLITCKRPDYKKYYLVLVFDLEYETDL